MLSRRMTQATLRALDWINAKIGRSGGVAEHLRTGQRGEEDAYFYLRRRGYVIIARNYRSPHYRGELDLVGWDGNVLCFIEVKTRTSQDVAPAQAAVDSDKQVDLSRMARDFLRHLPGASECEWRFDILSVYYDGSRRQPAFELFQNAFSPAYNRGFARLRRENRR